MHFILAEQFGFDPLKFIRGIRGIAPYCSDFIRFRSGCNTPISFYPCLMDKEQEGGATRNEYFWQDLLVARSIFETNPARHVDVGSRIDGFVAHVASFREVEVFDIRPVSTRIPGVIFRQANLMSEDSVSSYVQGLLGYCDSLSCLHAIEHFGLGRYGDPIDPLGYNKGIINLARLLLPNGLLYLATPIGQQRVEFNANWVFNPATIVSISSSAGLMLEKLTVLDQRGGSREIHCPTDSDLAELAKAYYHLGIFYFRKTGC